MARNLPPNPRRALDYPIYDDETWVCWASNGVKWPAANRRVSYLSKDKTDIMKGYALFTLSNYEAKTFTDEASARTWLEEQEALRGSSYGARVTTIGKLKEECGYA